MQRRSTTDICAVQISTLAMQKYTDDISTMLHNAMWGLKLRPYSQLDPAAQLHVGTKTPVPAQRVKLADTDGT